MKTTDFALLAGLEIKPLSCRRSNAPQSNDFQAILVKAEIEQGQDGFVDSVGVEVVHASPPRDETYMPGQRFCGPDPSRSTWQSGGWAGNNVPRTNAKRPPLMKWRPLR